MNMRASGASELRTFSHFHILKLLFPSLNVLLVLMILCLRNIYFQVSNYICNSLLICFDCVNFYLCRASVKNSVKPLTGLPY